MLCPYCLHDTAPPTCTNCKETLPPLYVSRHGNASGSAIFSAVGFSGHGKTVYLAALLHAMEKDLTRVWPRFYRQGLDMEAVRSVQQNLTLLQQGTLPESTRRNFPRPSLHLLRDMPVFGSRHLLMYDPPGEAFETDEGIERYAHFVHRAKVVLFLVSLVDLPEPRGSEMGRLLETYVLGMTRMKAKTRDQHLVVVFTKADWLKGQFAKCPITLQHLNAVDAELLSNPRKYLDRLKAVSDELAKFTNVELGARAFARLAKESFHSARYCAASALGSPPEDGRLTTAMEPRGVVDPLLWVLDKS